MYADMGVLGPSKRHDNGTWQCFKGVPLPDLVWFINLGFRVYLFAMLLTIYHGSWTDVIGYIKYEGPLFMIILWIIFLGLVATNKTTSTMDTHSSLEKMQEHQVYEQETYEQAPYSPVYEGQTYEPYRPTQSLHSTCYQRRDFWYTLRCIGSFTLCLSFAWWLYSRVSLHHTIISFVTSTVDTTKSSNNYPQCATGRLGNVLRISPDYANRMCDYFQQDTDGSHGRIRETTHILEKITDNARIGVLGCDYQYKATRGDVDSRASAVGYDVEHHRVEGWTFEALQRGRHPITGEFPPSEFRIKRANGQEDRYWKQAWDSIKHRSDYRQVKEKMVDGYFDAKDYQNGLVYRYDPEVVEKKLRQAVQQLEKKNVRGITSDVGYSQQFQELVARMTSTPVLLSPMGQLSLVSQFLAGNSHRKVVVVTANAHVFNPSTMIPAYIMPADMVRGQVIVAGMENNRFGRWVADGRSFSRLDKHADDDASVEHALQEVVMDVENRVRDIERDSGDEVVAVVMECTELPAYSNALRYRLGVPVYDAVTNMDWLGAGMSVGLYAAFMAPR